MVFKVEGLLTPPESPGSAERALQSQRMHTREQEEPSNAGIGLGLLSPGASRTTRPRPLSTGGGGLTSSSSGLGVRSRSRSSSTSDFVNPGEAKGTASSRRLSTIPAADRTAAGPSLSPQAYQSTSAAASHAHADDWQGSRSRSRSSSPGPPKFTGAAGPVTATASISDASASAQHESAEPLGHHLAAFSQGLGHHARLVVATATTAVSSALSTASGSPKSPSSPAFPSGFRAGPRTNAQHFNGSSGPGRRQLTTNGISYKDKGKSRSMDDDVDASGSALYGDRLSQHWTWHPLLQHLYRALPSLPQTGPKRVRTRTRRFAILLVSIAAIYYLFGSTLSDAYQAAAVLKNEQERAEAERESLGPNIAEYDRHPIEHLMKAAKEEWDAKLARQSKTAEEAVTEYKRRYKRDPPNGFKEWFGYAIQHGTKLPDEYDSLMASLEPFWALDPAELRRRTFQIGMQPSFALVHVEEAKDNHTGGTFWDANDDDELLKPFGVERARGLERMVRPFIGRPGIVNMVFAVNELAEPRVLPPWEEMELVKEALSNGTTVDLRENKRIPEKEKPFFPDPVWKGDGTTRDVFIRTCPPDSHARKAYSTMTGSVIHLADVQHVAYAKPRVFKDKKGHRVRKNVISDTVNNDDEEAVEVQINPPRKSRRRSTGSPLADQVDAVRGPDESHSGRPSHNRPVISSDTPGKDGWPASDVYLPGPEFQFNSNVTGLSHESLCGNPRLHDTQGQFCSDFRSVDSLYPVFSPSTMPGFADIVIPSHYYAATGPKYHLAPHIKKVKKAEKDPVTGKWHNIFVDEELPKWEERRNKIFWRGSTTGGGNNPAGRQLQYQRHRFLRQSSDNTSRPIGIVLPSSHASQDSRMTYVELPAQVINNETMDVAFTSLDGCGHEKVCNAVKYGMYRMANKVPLLEIAKYKMLLDLDGMAYSARFMALLESGAAVLKSTIYSEYYSDQIQPWYHFIPVSVMYKEIYNIYSFFLGNPAAPEELQASLPEESVEGVIDQAGHFDDKPETQVYYRRQFTLAAPNNQGAHEQALKEIGKHGQDWQLSFGSVMDMEIYCYRLALEWGRIWQRGGPIGTF